MMVLAAGTTAQGMVKDIDLEVVKQVMDINFMGYVNMTKHALPYLRTNKGTILVISSLSGMLHLPMRSIYCASKSAVNSYFRTLRCEQEDIKVLITSPGSIRGTNFRNNAIVKNQAMEDNSKELNAKEAALLTVLAADRGIEEILYPSKYWLVTVGLNNA